MGLQYKSQKRQAYRSTEDMEPMVSDIDLAVLPRFAEDSHWPCRKRYQLYKNYII